MDYKRIYHLCNLGIGVLFSIWFVPDLLAGSFGITTVLASVASVGLVASALYSLARPEVADGPTEPTPYFWVVVLGFILVFAGTVLSFV